MADVMQLSAAVRGLALELTRITNDLRLLASGPRTGLAEIRLPPVQPGSSIMPGKINPVMLEMLNQVCYQVLGQDAAVAAMTQAGQLELNVMMPALGSALFDMMDWLTRAMTAVTERALAGIEADRDRCRAYAHASVGLATLLNRAIGYSAAARVAQESEASGQPIADLVAAHGLMDRQTFADLVARARPVIPHDPDSGALLQPPRQCAAYGRPSSAWRGIGPGVRGRGPHRAGGVTLAGSQRPGNPQERAAICRSR